MCEYPPPPHHQVWGLGPHPYGYSAPPQGGWSPHPGRIDVPLPMGALARTGGAAWGSAAEWETIDRGAGARVAASPPGCSVLPWYGRGPWRVGGGPCPGVRGAPPPFAGRCPKAGGTLAEMVLLGHGVAAVASVMPRAPA